MCKPLEIDKGFKEKVYDCSGKRNDEWADQVRCRLSGALSDLYAVSARYHDDCRKQFMNPKNVARASKASNESVTKNLDIAFEALVDAIKSDPSHLWNSAELYKH